MRYMSVNLGAGCAFAKEPEWRGISSHASDLGG
jgi:hypothetical protein